MKKALIIGGGFAGMSAAVALAEKGVRVILLEAQKQLGGRAFSLEEDSSGEPVDHGHHAITGSSRETRRLLGVIGSADQLRFQKHFKMVFLKPGGGGFTLASSLLPGPFHLMGNLAFLPGFSRSDRMHLIRSGFSLIFRKEFPESWTVKQWLDHLRQPESLRRQLWHPLIASMLNEQHYRGSANVFVRLMKRSFFSRKKHAALGFIQGSLGDMCTEQARKFIEKKGGEVFFNTPVSHLLISKGGVDGAVLRNGGAVTADAYISAVPYHVLRRLLPKELTGKGKPFDYLHSIRHSPMIAAHLWFDRPVMEEEMVGLIDSPIQWVANKSRLWTEGERDMGALSCHMAAARNLIQKPREVLINRTIRELSRFFPEVKKARLVHARLIKERQATFSCTPETERIRPDQQTSVPHFYLAGDWTQTGLPSTLEGAVLSGRRCSELILKSW